MLKRKSIPFPSSFTLAIFLTFTTFLSGVIFTKHRVNEMVLFWGDGLWNLLSFSMQMLLILICGSALARSPFISNLITKLAKVVSTNTSAAFLITTISLIGCYFNWGFGLIIGALLAVELSKRVEEIDFPLLVACAYSGFLVWHGGLSGSIPLKLTAPSKEIQDILGLSSLSLSQTIFSSFNLSMLGVISVSLLGLNILVAKFFSNPQKSKLEKSKIEKVVLEKKGIEASPLFCYSFVALGFSYIVLRLGAGDAIDLNLMIMIFLFLGLAFHTKFSSYLNAFEGALKEGGSIIIQFPLYAGIMGMVASSGMGVSLSEIFVSISTKETFLFLTYLSSGLLNIFVPSGGGQWVIQGPIILTAAKNLGIEPGLAAMTIAWGDAWTNMIQPFWALPILAISGASLRDLMKYLCLIFVIVGGVSLFVIQLFS